MSNHWSDEAEQAFRASWEIQFGNGQALFDYFGRVLEERDFASRRAERERVIQLLRLLIKQYRNGGADPERVEAQHYFVEDAVNEIRAMGDA